MCWGARGFGTRAFLPRPAPVDLHFEREAQERPDQHDPCKDEQALDRWLDRDRVDDVSGDEKFESEKDGTAKAGSEVGHEGPTRVGSLRQPNQENRQRTKSSDDNDRGANNLYRAGGDVDPIRFGGEHGRKSPPCGCRSSKLAVYAGYREPGQAAVLATIAASRDRRHSEYA